MSEIKTIINLLQSRRFSLSDEKRLQEEIAETFIDAGVEHKRECRLSGEDIIDFLVGSIGIEVKIKGAKLNIFRQVERYAQHEKIHRLILATNVPMGMPDLVNGKPVHVVNLGRAWL